MKVGTVFTLLMVFVATGSAQERMADTLRKGVVEEDSKQNLNAAIQDYQAVLAQFNDARQTAATALFRMAECYRKGGKAPEAIAAYQRVVREFADQSKLAEQSRGVLAKSYPAAGGTGGLTVEEQQAQREIAKRTEARARYRQTIEDEKALIVRQMDRVKSLRAQGVIPADALDSLNERLLKVDRELAAFDAGMPLPVER